MSLISENEKHSFNKRKKKQHLEYACEDPNLDKREHTEQLDIKHNWRITKFSFTYFFHEMLLKIKKHYV